MLRKRSAGTPCVTPSSEAKPAPLHAMTRALEPYSFALPPSARRRASAHGIALFAWKAFEPSCLTVVSEQFQCNRLAGLGQRKKRRRECSYVLFTARVAAHPARKTATPAAKSL